MIPVAEDVAATDASLPVCPVRSKVTSVPLKPCWGHVELESMVVVPVSPGDAESAIEPVSAPVSKPASPPPVDVSTVATSELDVAS